MPDYDPLVKKYESQQKHNILIDGVSVEEQINLTKHLWNVSCLQFSQNGLYLASGSWDKLICIWDLRTLDEPKVLNGNGKGHTSAVTCLEWLPQIEFLLSSGSADKSLLVWNSETGEILAKLNQHDTWVLDTTFTEDGKIMASSSWDGHVVLWDMTTVKPVNLLNGHDTGVWLCMFSQASNSPVLCTGGEDTSLRIWDLRKDNRWHSDIILSGLHTDAIKCGSWTSCGNYVAAGSMDSKVSVWDVRTNKAIHCLEGHSSHVSDVSFLPSSSNILFSVGDTRCCFWNTVSGTCEGSMQQHRWSYEVESLAITPDSTLLATGGVDRQIILSTVDIGESYQQHLITNSDLSPTSQIPVKTQSKFSVSELGISSGDVVDRAKECSANREHPTNESATKQAVLIKVPATSDYLKTKLSELKSSDNEKSKMLSTLDSLRPQMVPDEGSMRYKSKELLEERKKLRSTIKRPEKDISNQPHLQEAGNSY